MSEGGRPWWWSTVLSEKYQHFWLSCDALNETSCTIYLSNDFGERFMTHRCSVLVLSDTLYCNCFYHTVSHCVWKAGNLMRLTISFFNYPYIMPGQIRQMLLVGLISTRGFQTQFTKQGADQGVGHFKGCLYGNGAFITDQKTGEHQCSLCSLTGNSVIFSVIFEEIRTSPEISVSSLQVFTIVPNPCTWFTT